MKNIFKKITICILVLFCFSCKQKIITEVKEVNALPASAIFNDDSVYNFNEKYKNLNKEIAISYIKQIDDYKKNNSDKAIYCAKRAITLMPSLENYKILADLYGKYEKYEEQSAVYNFIAYQGYFGINSNYSSRYLFGKPSEDLIYESIVSTILSKQGLVEIYYTLHDELGFDINKIKERLIKDERIKLDRESDAFRHILLQLLPFEAIANYSKKPEIFSQFLNSIKDTNSFFTINEDEIRQFYYNSFFDGEGPEEISFNNFSNYYTYEKITDSTKYITYNMNRGFKLNSNITVLEYSVDTSEIACPKEMRHIYHRIITFDSDTKMIDSKVIAFQNGEEMATVIFKKNKYIMTLNKRIFKKPYVKNDFDNDLLKIQKIKDASFAIRENGAIEELLN